MLPLLKILTSQAFGSRRECLDMIRDGGVEWRRGTSGEWIPADDPVTVLEPDGLWIRYNGLELPVLPRLHVALHKPSGYECSRSPGAHASVLELLPEPFVRRSVQPAGRLDVDTTGLLILTDDGNLNHALTAPKRKLPKTYRIGLKHPITGEQVAALEAGVILRDDPEPTAPATVLRLGEREADITITEGRYHQVKRMWAAVGNRVESIHRIAIGPLTLGDLAEGEWRYLRDEEIRKIEGVSA